MKYINHLDIFTSTTRTCLLSENIPDVPDLSLTKLILPSLWFRTRLWCLAAIWVVSQDKNNSPLIETIMICCIQALDVSGVSRMELFQSYLQLYENMMAYQSKESRFFCFVSSFVGVEGQSTTVRGNAMEIAIYLWRKHWCQSCLGMLLTSAQ